MHLIYYFVSIYLKIELLHSSNIPVIHSRQSEFGHLIMILNSYGVYSWYFGAWLSILL